MKLKCNDCGHDFEGNISLKDGNWMSVCPKCGCEFTVEVPKGRIRMMFVDDSDPDLDDEHFTDNFVGRDIRSYYAFDNPEDFIEAWYKMRDNPDGMWYWVLDGEELITSGACDPDDDDGFAEHFGFNLEELRENHKEVGVTLEEKKAEAIERMRMLGIFPQTISQFKEDGHVSISMDPWGAFYWADGEDLEHIREFEAEYDALVYVAIRSYMFIGCVDSYLFVSKYKEEWPKDRDDIRAKRALAYVYNHDAPECSEIGYIGIEPTIAAGLKRTW